MKIDMIVRMEDIPGSLIKVIEPISLHGGNIKSVLHLRSEKDYIPVQILFEIDDRKSLEMIKNEISARISEIKIEGKSYYKKETKTFMMIGHIIDTNVRDTIDRLNKIGLVNDLSIVMPDPDKESSVLMKVDVDSSDESMLMDELKEICDEKKILLIKSV